MPERDDVSMRPTYIRVLILEAVIVFGLWILGRVYSS